MIQKAAHVKPSLSLQANRAALRECVGRYKAANPRVFGSVIDATESRAPDLLKHIVEAAELACSYVASLSKDEFLGDTRTQRAVIIGEVAI